MPPDARPKMTRFTFPRFPGDMIIIPMILGILMSTFARPVLQMGGIFTAVVSNTLAIVGVFLFFLGATIDIKSLGRAAKTALAIIGCRPTTRSIPPSWSNMAPMMKRCYHHVSQCRANGTMLARVGWLGQYLSRRGRCSILPLCWACRGFEPGKEEILASGVPPCTIVLGFCWAPT